MKRSIILAAILFFTLACSLSDIPTPAPAATATATATFTPEASATPTITHTPTKTKTPRPTLTPTPDAGALAINRIKAYNNPDLDYLLKYYADYIPVPLDDYVDDAAKENTIFSSPMQFQPKVFMVISNIKYEHPDDRITKANAGCGFLFHDNDKDKSYFAYISANSMARLSNLMFKRYVKGVAHHKITEKPLTSPNGGAEVIVAVMDDRFVMVVDGVIEIDQSITWDSEGNFGYTISSGTNKGYGTRCYFSDTVIFTDPADLPDGTPNG
jgi:hypothetical protein